MGACYSVKLAIRLKDEISAVHALKEYISTADNVNFNIEKQIKRGLTTDTFEDLIRIFLSGCDQEVKEIVHFCCVKHEDSDDDWESDDYIDDSVNVDWNAENWREQLENDMIIKLHKYAAMKGYSLNKAN